jgi:hypothetical protein
LELALFQKKDSGLPFIWVLLKLIWTKTKFQNSVKIIFRVWKMEIKCLNIRSIKSCQLKYLQSTCKTTTAISKSKYQVIIISHRELYWDIEAHKWPNYKATFIQKFDNTDVQYSRFSFSYRQLVIFMLCKHTGSQSYNQTYEFRNKNIE